MSIFFNVIKHIIINKNKNLHKLFYTLFASYKKKHPYPNFISII
jgi:hypothetical protein